jgi:cobalt-zinc-cadmium efflux system membrane fusion protein
MYPFHTTLRLAASVSILSLTSCNQFATSGPQRAESPAEAAAPVGKSLVADAVGATEPSGVQEKSDLDRPIEDLFSSACEHGMKTFECDECRYETGVVKAPAGLFEGGLLRTETVSSERVEFPLSLTGEVRFDERRVAHVSTQAGGTVREVRVALGDKVNKGQALMEIESVEIGEAEGAYLEADAVLRLARRSHERAAELWKKGLSSEKEYLDSKQGLETAEISAKSAFGKLIRLGMAAADVQALSMASAVGRFVLRAPADGTVLSLNAVSGELVKTEESLAIIGDNATVWVWADLYERDIALVTRRHLERRLSATVAVKAYPDEEFPGTVDIISPAMNEVSRTAGLRLQVKNPGGKLLGGMFANVKIFLPSDAQALSVSRSAVLDDEGRAFVFIHHHGDYYVRRPVSPGRSWADRIEVVKGLREGETVVADGSFLMKSDVLRSKMGAGCAD